MTTLLIDGDILLFKFGCRHASKSQWRNGATSESTDAPRALADTDAFIRSLLSATGCKEYIVCFTNHKNFRYGVLPSYKHNRVNSIPPVLLPVIKNHLRTNHPYETRELLEADDLIGILATSDPKKYVVASTDKDFKSLPVKLFNWDKDRTPRLIGLREADYWFHYQWLIGDSTDGYSGCAGAGPKFATALLNSQSPADWSACVIATYALHKKITYSWADILTQARVARILRVTDWDAERKQPILWTPNC